MREERGVAARWASSLASARSRPKIRRVADASDSVPRVLPPATSGNVLSVETFPAWTSRPGHPCAASECVTTGLSGRSAPATPGREAMAGSAVAGTRMLMVSPATSARASHARGSPEPSST